MKGQPVLVLEAMKMEHRIAAPAAGVVAECTSRRAGRSRPEPCWPIIEEGDA